MAITSLQDVLRYLDADGRLQQAELVKAVLAGADGSALASASNPVPAIVFDKPINVAGTTLTRPANTTAYAAGDSISDNATAGSVTALPATVADINDATVMITELLLETTDTGLAAGVPIEVEVFNSDPTASSGVGGGDNAAYSNKRAGWAGRFQGVFVAFSDGGKAVCVPADGQAFSIINPESGGKRLWCQYKVLGGFTPSANSTTIGIRFKGLQGRA